MCSAESQYHIQLQDKRSCHHLCRRMTIHTCIVKCTVGPGYFANLVLTPDSKKSSQRLVFSEPQALKLDPIYRSTYLTTQHADFDKISPRPRWGLKCVRLIKWYFEKLASIAFISYVSFHHRNARPRVAMVQVVQNPAVVMQCFCQSYLSYPACAKQFRGGGIPHLPPYKIVSIYTYYI